MTPKEILNLKFYCDDHDRTLTIREYFVELLQSLWYEGEGFSGKRPFGNSGWQWDLYKPLIENKLIKGKLDSEGESILEVDEEAGWKLINKCIWELKNES